MTESDTPRTDAIAEPADAVPTTIIYSATELVQADFARELERENARLREQFNATCSPESFNDLVRQRTELLSELAAAKAERDALRAELAAANANISDLYEVVRAFAHVAQHGPHDPSPLDENSPLMDAVRDVLAKVGA